MLRQGIKRGVRVSQVEKQRTCISTRRNRCYHHKRSLPAVLERQAVYLQMVYRRVMCINAEGENQGRIKKSPTCHAKASVPRGWETTKLF